MNPSKVGVRVLLFMLLIGLSPVAVKAQADLFCVDPFTDAYHILNRTTGAAATSGVLSVAGFTVTGANGAALHPTTHEMFVILKLSGVAGRVLATVDRTTGVCTQIGNLGDNFSCLAFTSAGVLYGVTGDGASVPETLYTIDTATAAKTLAWTLGNGVDGEVIAYYPVDGQMYHCSGNGTVVYESINLTTGAITPISGALGTGEIFGMVWDPDQNLFVCGNINSNILTLSTTGVVTTGATAPLDPRGLILIPDIQVSTNSLNLGTTQQGTAGTPQSFDVTGTHLWADITITPPTGVVVSLTMSGGYGPSLTLTQTAGSVATTTVYARIQASASVGAISGNIDLTSTGADTESISLTGTVTPPAPEMDVLNGATSIADGGTDALGNVPFGSVQSVTYTIENTGSVTLNLTGTPVVVVTAGTNTQNVAVVAQPTASVAAAGTVAFTVNFEVVTAAAFDFTVSIANDDSDENPYDWTVSGTGVAAPEMDVSRAVGVADGSTDAVGNAAVGAAQTLTYTISNNGTTTLNLSNAITSSALNCTVSVTTQPAATVAAAGNTTLVVSVIPSAAGAFSFDISIANDDLNENPYNWTVSGTGTTATGSGGGGGGDGGCSTGGDAPYSWLALLGLLSLGAVAIRLRKA